jgi:tetratricopeptide (TPR) repeat protein
MSEEIAGTTPESADPAALSLALAGASREEADAYLRDQRHHIHEQLKQIHLDIWEKWLGVLLRIATLAIGLVVAAGLAAAVWEASRADGTVVDAFSVPPQLEQAGISGQVVATDLTERITSIHDIAQRSSLSSPKEVRQESAEDIKVEIPETGVSLGQAWRYLRRWLGREHHLTGSLRLNGGSQITLTVAMDGRRVVAAGGAATDLDKLEQQAAEQLFADVDPDNIVLYLRAMGRDSEALEMAERCVQIVREPPQLALAYGLWASLTRSVLGDMRLSLARARAGVETDPKIMVGPREMMWADILMGHDEEALQIAQSMRNFREEDQFAQQGQGFHQLLVESAFQRNTLLGDFAQAASEGDCAICPLSQQLMSRSEAYARAHDGSMSRSLAARAMAEHNAPTDRRNARGTYMSRARYFQDVMREDWPAAVASARSYEAQVKADPTLSPAYGAVRLHIQVAPLLAYAVARNGDTAGAEAIIAATPQDCYDCLRIRGAIAAAAKQMSRADGWFARAVALAPSLPAGYSDWGQSMLARGQPDAAIEKFTLANQKGPHFADPLEYWGEALIAKNQSHLALAKFEEANKYAPNWGRLHLKWSEALAYSGKKDEAAKQFARAAQLDLTPSEKSELARSHAAATNP